MAASFSYTANPARILFGQGSCEHIGDELERLRRDRVLILASPGRAADADRVVTLLGPMAVARFDGVAQHTPVPVTEQALKILRSTDADCVVALGGGSTTGLAKALATRTGVDQIIIPTTYAGSEVTAILGETVNGRKTTRSASSILPETVIYDVELTRSLPLPITVSSAINAMAHAVEALYAADANPVIDSLALQAIISLAGGLRTVSADPTGIEPRSALLMGAWLAGTCLGSVGMSLHHKLCHVLGGAFDLPHAATHTVILPHAMAYNAVSAPDAMARVASALGAVDAPTAIFDLAVELGAPTSLRELGMPESGIDDAAELTVANPYPNPRPLDRDAIEALLRDAWSGTRPPGPAARPDAGLITVDVLRSFDGTPRPRLRRLVSDLVPRLHGYAIDNDLTQDEWESGIDFLTRTGQLSVDGRQEFVLLSDTLGLSSVVDVLTNSRSPEATPSAVLGPFYRGDPPEVAAGGDLSAGQPGTPLYVDVQITDTDGVVVADALVDVWQADADGFYDVQLPDVDGPVLRGRLRSDVDGRVRFRTILPVEYPIPTDGPVGSMLAASGRHPFRAPHLHFLISAPGHVRLITQLFVAGGAYLDSDAVFGVKDALIVDYEAGVGPSPDGHYAEGEWRSLRYTFRLQRSSTLTQE